MAGVGVGGGTLRGRGSVTKEGLKMVRKMGQGARGRWRAWDGQKKSSLAILEELEEGHHQGKQASDEGKVSVFRGFLVVPWLPSPTRRASQNGLELVKGGEASLSSRPGTVTLFPVTSAPDSGPQPSCGSGEKREGRQRYSWEKGVDGTRTQREMGPHTRDGNPPGTSGSAMSQGFPLASKAPSDGSCLSFRPP